MERISSKAILFACLLATKAAYCDLADKVEPPKKIRVAVIDSGIHPSLMDKKFLCKEGHKDFTDTGLEDVNGHGSNVSGLIDQYVKDKIIGMYSMPEILSTDADYCQIIIKFWDPRMKNSALETTVAAFKYAISLNVDVINYSAGGTDYYKEEHKIIKKALDSGINIIVSAGNHANNIEKHPFYPANLDPRLIVVGNLTIRNSRAETSNYGSIVDVWEIGQNRISYASDNTTSILSGTSQAAAVHTGKFIRKLILKSSSRYLSGVEFRKQPQKHMETR
jgi:hypothetical protein